MTLIISIITKDFTILSADTLWSSPDGKKFDKYSPKLFFYKDFNISFACSGKMDYRYKNREQTEKETILERIDYLINSYVKNSQYSIKDLPYSINKSLDSRNTMLYLNGVEHNVLYSYKIDLFSKNNSPEKNSFVFINEFTDDYSLICDIKFKFFEIKLNNNLNDYINCLIEIYNYIINLQKIPKVGGNLEFSIHFKDSEPMHDVIEIQKF